MVTALLVGLVVGFVLAIPPGPIAVACVRNVSPCQNERTDLHRHKRTAAARDGSEGPASFAPAPGDSGAPVARNLLLHTSTTAGRQGSSTLHVHEGVDDEPRHQHKRLSQHGQHVGDYHLPVAAIADRDVRHAR
jgi:hypothetical protein